MSLNGFGLLLSQEVHGVEREIVVFDMIVCVHDWKAFLSVRSALRMRVFHGAQWIACHLRDLGVGEAVKEGHLKCLALFSGQLM